MDKSESSAGGVMWPSATSEPTHQKQTFSSRQQKIGDNSSFLRRKSGNAQSDLPITTFEKERASAPIIRQTKADRKYHSIRRNKDKSSEKVPI